MKTCSKCGVEKALTEFWKRIESPDGLQGHCGDCGRKGGKEWRKKNPTKHKMHRMKAFLKASYGVSPKEKEALVLLQGGRCAICMSKFSSSVDTHLDHVHGSAPVVVRGILCARCNFGLGYFKDSPERLIKAAEYLKKFQEKT